MLFVRSANSLALQPRGPEEEKLNLNTLKLRSEVLHVLTVTLNVGITQINSLS